jgi:hypothetical protein
MSDGLLQDAWKYIVESGYLALLEGFSKIYNCSTEGRALMSIDLATFASSISKRALTEKFRESIGSNRECLAPPAIIDFRGKQYVDTYIKVFYFPNEVRLTYERHPFSYLYMLQSLLNHLSSCCCAIEYHRMS